jgi:hypothetical protein
MESYCPVLGTATAEQAGGPSPGCSCSSLLRLGSAGWQKSLLSLLPAMLALESVGAPPWPWVGAVFSAAARAASNVIWLTTSSISWDRPAEGLTDAAGGCWCCGAGSLGLETGCLVCSDAEAVGGEAPSLAIWASHSQWRLNSSIDDILSISDVEHSLHS